MGLSRNLRVELVCNKERRPAARCTRELGAFFINELPNICLNFPAVQSETFHVWNVLSLAFSSTHAAAKFIQWAYSLDPGEAGWNRTAVSEGRARC